MFHEEITTVAKAASTKFAFLRNNSVGYLISSMFAGVFVGFGILLIFTISGLMDGISYSKIIMGMVFGGVLCMVIIAGAELFTGNNFVMAVGISERTVSITNAMKLWAVSLLGNWLGSVLLSILFVGTGLASSMVGEVIASSASAKMSMPFLPLFLRSVLCNVLVCLAVWASFRAKSEIGKIVLMFWCLFVFITVGFEHSIANMTVLTIALLKPFSAAISISGYFYNMLVVILGNMIGGIFFVALPYVVISKKK